MLPLLVLAVLAVMQVGLVVRDQLGVVHAARRGGPGGERRSRSGACGAGRAPHAARRRRRGRATVRRSAARSASPCTTRRSPTSRWSACCSPIPTCTRPRSCGWRSEAARRARRAGGGQHRRCWRCSSSASCWRPGAARLGGALRRSGPGRVRGRRRARSPPPTVWRWATGAAAARAAAGRHRGEQRRPAGVVRLRGRERRGRGRGRLPAVGRGVRPRPGRAKAEVRPECVVELPGC